MSGGKNNSLVENPNSHEKVVTSIKEWATCGDTRYTQTWSKMKSVSIDDLKNKQASWHRNCYRDAVHTGMLKRAKERYERQLEGPNEARRKSRDITQEPSQLTCSQISPYNRGARFFCEGHPGYQETLHSISTFPAGESLLAAVELSWNDELHMKLSTAVDASDAHAIDLKYHKKCWASNVMHVPRKPSLSSAESTTSLSSEITAKIEYLTTTEITLKERRILTMSDLKNAFAEPECNRKHSMKS